MLQRNVGDVSDPQHILGLSGKFSLNQILHNPPGGRLATQTMFEVPW